MAYDRKRELGRDPAKRKASSRAYRERNKERIAQTRREKRLANIEHVRARQRRAALRYRMKNIAAVRARDAAFHRAMPWRSSEKQRRRRATMLKATPAWGNRFFIEEAYALADLRTKVTGLRWQVDHIAPLLSGVVCGLHVEHNLRVVPAISNARKKNKHLFASPSRSDQWPTC